MILKDEEQQGDGKKSKKRMAEKDDRGDRRVSEER